MRWKPVISVIMGMFMLTACVAQVPSPSPSAEAGAEVPTAVEEVQEPEKRLSMLEFTLGDAMHAQLIAEQDGDVIAIQCWKYVVDKMSARKEATGEDGIDLPTGAMTLLQKSRGVVKKADEGISDEAKLACGPLLVDAKGDLLKILLKLSPVL